MHTPARVPVLALGLVLLLAAGCGTSSTPAGGDGGGGGVTDGGGGGTPDGGGGGTDGGAGDAGSGNPVPLVTALSPCGAVAGSGDLTVTVTGSGFVAGTTATFDGTAVIVTPDTATTVSLTVPAALLATAPASDEVSVVVTNPGPGGGDSNASGFGIASRAVTLAGDVQPIFDASCATSGCHVSPGGLAPMDLSDGHSYGFVLGVQSSECSADRVRACGPTRGESVLVDKILATSASPPCAGVAMPKRGSLSASDIQTLLDWIAQGAPQ